MIKYLSAELPFQKVFGMVMSAIITTAPSLCLLRHSAKLLMLIPLHNMKLDANNITAGTDSGARDFPTLD
jgi:hypothetical protein